MGQVWGERSAIDLDLDLDLLETETSCTETTAPTTHVWLADGACITTDACRACMTHAVSPRISATGHATQVSKVLEDEEEMNCNSGSDGQGEVGFAG